MEQYWGKNKKLRSIHRINLPKTMRIITTDVVRKGIRHIPVIRSNIWLTFDQASMKAKWKEIEMNFINSDGLDWTYNDIDLFGGPSEKTDHLINNENTSID